MKPTCKASLKNSLFEKIDKAEVVSFDVFDTLLLRPFVHPFDVFSYLEYFFEPPACMRGPGNLRLQIWYNK